MGSAKPPIALILQVGITKIDPDLLRAISWKESRYRVNAIGINPVTGYGSGLMQVDSQHFNELARYGIKPEHLTTDPCMNIYTGAYYLAIAFKKMGRLPGGRWCIQCRIQEDRTPEPETSCLRIRGLPDLYRIKSSKGIRVPTTKKSLSQINSVQKKINIVYIVKYRLCRDSGMERPHKKISYE
nr:hypothetical protein [Escherichia coli]